MANCGCTEDACNCIVVGLGTVSASQVGDTWFVTGTETPFTGQSTDQTIQITGGGAYGHDPDIEVNPDPDGGLEAQANGLGIKVDPNSSAPVTLTADGLRVDCCGSLWSNSAQSFSPDIFLRLGEASGFVAANDGALPPDGAYNGNVTLGNVGSAVGDPDKSVDFDGATAYVDVPYDVGYSLWNNVTIHASINPDTIAGDDVIVDNLDLGNTGFRIYLDNGEVKLDWGDGANVYTIASGVTVNPIDGWKYVVAKLGPTTARLYINGAIVASNLATTYVPQTAFPLYVGSEDGSSNYFDGQLDEIVIWPLALTDANILFLYQTIAGIILQIVDTNTVDLTYNNLLLSADVRLDPASTATVTTGPAGIRIDETFNTVSDTATINLTLTGPGDVSGVVIPNTSLGIENTAGGVAANIQGAPAVVAVTTEDRLRFNTSGEITYVPDGVTNIDVAASAVVAKSSWAGGGALALQQNNLLSAVTHVNTRSYAVFASFQCEVTGFYRGNTVGASNRLASMQYRIDNNGATTGVQLTGTSSANHTWSGMGDILFDNASGRFVRFRSQLNLTWLLQPGQQAVCDVIVMNLEDYINMGTSAVNSGDQAVACDWLIYPARV